MHTFSTLENLHIANEYIIIRRYDKSDFVQLEQLFNTANLSWFMTKYNNLSELSRSILC